MILDFFNMINPIVWMLSNMALIYIGILLFLFVVTYQIFFNPRATTGGEMVFRFAFSLMLLVAVIIIGNYLNPRDDIPWYQFPDDILWWRPTVRLSVFIYVGYTITTLVVFLWKRKFKPEILKTAPDKLLVKPRNDTTEIPIIEEISDDR